MVDSPLYLLYEYACEEGLFIKRFLKHIIPTVCEQSNLEVVDFDKTKEIISSRLGFEQQPKSCDALSILFDANKVLFIEMKSFQLFKKWQLSKKDRTVHSYQIDEQISKFNIVQKFVDSVMLFNKVLQMSEINKEWDATYTNVILTDIPLENEENSEMFIEFTLFYLTDEALEPDLLIQARLSQYLQANFSIDDKPILLNCDQLVSYTTA